MKHALIRCLSCGFLLLCSFYTSAQQQEQIWLDFQVDYPFANRYLFETTASYQTLMNESSWRNISITPVFEYLAVGQFDFIGTLPILFTQQKDSVNTFQLDPSIGTRWNITQNKRVDARLIFKVEERFLQRIESTQGETSTRLRLKAEAWVAFNGPNLFVDNLLYGIVDYEEFFVADQQLNERFAFRRRARIGVGYRLDYKHRFELALTRQSSRDQIDGGFLRDDNVIQLRYKIFLNPAKVTASPEP